MIELNGDTLRRWRIAHGRTQSDLADELGVDQSVVSRWETNGSRPDLPLRRALQNRIITPAEERRRLWTINISLGRRMAIIDGQLAAASALLLSDHGGMLHIGDRMPISLEAFHRERLERIEAEIGRPSHEALMIKFNSMWKQTHTGLVFPCLTVLSPGRTADGRRLWVVTREPPDPEIGDGHRVVVPDEFFK